MTGLDGALESDAWNSASSSSVGGAMWQIFGGWHTFGRLELDEGFTKLMSSTWAATTCKVLRKEKKKRRDSYITNVNSNNSKFSSQEHFQINKTKFAEDIYV